MRSIFRDLKTYSFKMNLLIAVDWFTFYSQSIDSLKSNGDRIFIYEQMRCSKLREVFIAERLALVNQKMKWISTIDKIRDFAFVSTLIFIATIFFSILLTSLIYIKIVFMTIAFISLILSVPLAFVPFFKGELIRKRFIDYEAYLNSEIQLIHQTKIAEENERIPTFVEDSIQSQDKSGEDVRIAVQAKIPCSFFHFLIENNLIKDSKSRAKKHAKKFILNHFFNPEDNTEFKLRTITNQFSLLSSKGSRTWDLYLRFIEYLEKFKERKHASIHSKNEGFGVARENTALIMPSLLESFKFEINEEELQLILRLFFEVCYAESYDPPVVKLLPDEYSQLAKLLKNGIVS